MLLLIQILKRTVMLKELLIMVQLIKEVMSVKYYLLENLNNSTLLRIFLYKLNIWNLLLPLEIKFKIRYKTEIYEILI